MIANVSLPHPQRNEEQSMKSKLKRHEGLLTVIGALIVFATFIVKDTIRERYKEWAESIDSAEVHYKLASELGAANKGIWEANDKVSQALDRLNERKYGAKNRSEV